MSQIVKRRTSMSIQSVQRAAFAISILAVGLFAAESPFAGNWKLNAAKSKLAGSGLGGGGVHVESDGTTYKASVDAIDEKGQPLKYDYACTLDGKPSKVTGSATTDELSLKRVNEHTIDVTAKKAGKVVYTDKRTVSKDGKTYTISRTGTSPDGKKYHATIVFDKQ
jgi:hypothetical protein